MNDRRIVYGAQCGWWGSISQAATVGISSGVRLPCCPHCAGMLFEMGDESEWFAGVDRFEARGNPGYRKFVEWWRGKHFASFEDAAKAYEAETGLSSGRGIK